VVFAADALLEHSVGAIEALSTIRALPQGDIPGAYRRAAEIAALNPNWASVELRRARDSAVLFDLRRPLASPVPAAAPRATPDHTVVGGIVHGGAGCPCVAIDRAAAGPDGGYVVTVLMSVRPFLKLLPPTSGDYAVSAITTGDGRFVARSLNHEERVGQLASSYLRSAVSGGKASGIYRGFTLEGLENYSAFARSPRSGWSAHLALGVRSIDSPTERFLGSLGIAALLALILALALVGFVIRQLGLARRAAEHGQQAQKLEALGQLTGGIAHDFNNLLTPIVGALDFLLKRATLDDRGRRIAGGALASAERAGKLTAQLLAFSRRQKLAIAPVDLAALLREMEPILDQAAGKDHVVEIAVAPGDLWVRTDYNQLELALLNLVINARDAAPAGGAIRIEAAVERSGDTHCVAIRVSDRGEGMSEEVRKRALEPFFTTTAGGRGTGLGLAQVFGVMQQSDGGVEIESRPGEGTTIILRLPVSDVRPVARGGAHDQPLVGVALRQLHLLIVDDDPAVRASIGRVFEDDGHIVDSVGDARIALRAIEVCDYDLALIDFAMPVMDGAGLIRAARKLRPAQKFLMVTGFSDSDAVAAACPDTPVVRKPFDNDALRNLVVDLAGGGA
jgi:signal transduction histidine kinase